MGFIINKQWHLKFLLCVALVVSAGLMVLAGCQPASQPIDPSGSPAVPERDAGQVTGPSPSPTPTGLSPTRPQPTYTIPLRSPPTASVSVATASPAASGRPQATANANVVQVRAVHTAGGPWTFHVTVEHPDVGWEDYADGWDVVLPDGTVVRPDPDSPFTRLLLHPHVDEQPFTRSQSGIIIPPGITVVRVRAHDLVDGYGGREIAVDLTLTSGEGFEVERSP